MIKKYIFFVFADMCIAEMSAHNLCFYEKLTKNIFNYHQITSFNSLQIMVDPYLSHNFSHFVLVDTNTDSSLVGFYRSHHTGKYRPVDTHSNLKIQRGIFFSFALSLSGWGEGGGLCIYKHKWTEKR